MSQAKQFFIIFDSPPASLPCLVTLVQPELHHQLINVLRYQPGKELVLVSQHDATKYQAVLEDFKDNENLTFSLLHRIEEETLPLPKITLVNAILKETHWDWLIQKATELGVETIQPLITHHGVVKLKAAEFGKKQERWQAIAQRAAQQSEQTQLPVIQQPITVAELIEQLKQKSEAIQPILLLERTEGQHLSQLLPPHPASPARGEETLFSEAPNYILIVGPEGGWHSSEIEAMLASGIEPASLGPMILRSETAAITAIAGLLYASQAEHSKQLISGMCI